MDPNPQQSYILRNRNFTPEDLIVIRQIISQLYTKGRTEISREICRRLDWYQPNGWLKDRACRDALLRLDSMKIIKLPPPKFVRSKKREIDTTLQKSAQWLSVMPIIDHYFRPRIVNVKGTHHERTWNELVKVFHYQSYSVIVGQNIKYIAFLNDIPIACLGWGSAAWSVEVRDQWLKQNFGWNQEDIRENLPNIINNVRFLILPWVRVKNLASTLLSLMEDIVIRDWKDYYRAQPILLETFVEQARFKGTCYKAANWLQLGSTKGVSKKGNYRIKHDNIKYMFVKPIKVKKTHATIIQVHSRLYHPAGRNCSP